jgi:hypothetical protein
MTMQMLNADVWRSVLEKLYSSIRCEPWELLDNDPEPDHAGEDRWVLQTREEFSEYALVCKLFHKELQQKRQKEIAAAVAIMIDRAPSEAIRLVDCANENMLNWHTLPRTTARLLSVYLGSREVFAVGIERERLDDEDDMDKPVAQGLSLMCRVHRRTDGGPWFSPDLQIPVHELCAVFGDEFVAGDTASYLAWHDATCADVRAWLAEQYAAMTAAV